MFIELYNENFFYKNLYVNKELKTNDNNISSIV